METNNRREKFTSGDKLEKFGKHRRRFNEEPNQ